MLEDSPVLVSRDLIKEVIEHCFGGFILSRTGLSWPLCSLSLRLLFDLGFLFFFNRDN